MDLTAKQVKQLRLMLRFRQLPPTVSAYVRLSVFRFVYLIAVCGAGVAFFQSGGWPIVSGFIGGMFFATLVWDLRLFSQIVRNWPLTNEVTDWERVEQFVGEASTREV